MLNTKDFSQYLNDNFIDISDRFIDNQHISGYCPNCKRDVAFNITNYNNSTFISYAGGEPISQVVSGMPRVIGFRCPITGCGHFKIWIVIKTKVIEKLDNAVVEKTFLLNSIPDENEEIIGIPNEPAHLKSAYKEAIRCMNARAPMAAAAMLRRALQVITRNILGATPGKLANELKELKIKGTNNKLGVALSSDFSDNTYILREVGNQGAHPDDDPDLLSFDNDDAENLHKIFAEVVAEIFVAPAIAKKAKEDFLRKRKIILS